MASTLSGISPMTPNVPAALPSLVDRYRLLRRLGSGSSGIVYEADDSTLARRVAIKLIPGVDRSQGVREARLASQVQHPRVVALLAAGPYAGGVYLVMEFVEGQSVQKLLRHGPLPWREATTLLIGACEGLMAVHDRGIIHGDIKPANLLCTAAGNVKLADFGLARPIRGGKIPILPLPDSARSKSHRHGLAGTPHYMSPEQCREQECDERTDIYALGATYHTILTGKTPYADATPLQVMFEHCSAPAPDPHRIQCDIPQACAAVVVRAMAKQRADRYDSAREMRRALREALRGRSKP